MSDLPRVNAIDILHNVELTNQEKMRTVICAGLVPVEIMRSFNKTMNKKHVRYTDEQWKQEQDRRVSHLLKLLESDNDQK